jgi:arylsulfatase
MVGSRAIYHDGFKATTDHIGRQLTVERELVPGSHDFDEDRWSLYDLSADFAEAHDLAEEQPERVRELIDRWWVEAGRNQVLPLDDSLTARAVALEPAPWGPRARAVLRPGGGGVNEDALPPLGAGFRVRAALDVPASGPVEGVVCALGDWSNGWAVYVLDGRPVVTFNLFGGVVRAEGEAALPPGRVDLLMEFRRDRTGGGPLVLSVDGVELGTATVPEPLPFRWQIGGAGLLVGLDAGFPVCDDYTPPFPATFRIEEVVVEVPALLPRSERDAAVDVAQAMHHE